MNEPADGKAETQSHPLASDQYRWKIWTVRFAVFSLVFIGLLGAFSVLGTIVEQFFIALYTD